MANAQLTYVSLPIENPIYIIVDKSMINMSNTKAITSYVFFTSPYNCTSNINKTGNVRKNVILRCIWETIVAVEKQ
jgi:hypothetical protein